MWAEDSTVSASKITSSSASWTGSASETWSVSVTGGATNQNVTNSYAQVGTSSNPSTSISFSTSGISGTITSIVVNCAAYQGKAKISATVDGDDFGTQNQSVPSWSSNTGGDVTFSGSNSGTIIITMTNGSRGRAMYIKSITVTYTPSGGGSDPSITANNVNIAQDATSGSIAYTLNNATGNVTASVTSGNWLTLGDITASAVAFTCSTNTGAQRTATVTLSFEGATDKLVTITQAAKTVAAPDFSLPTGNYIQGTTFTITSAGNTIYYNIKTDGSAPSDPTNASTEYTAPIVMGSGKTIIKAIAYDTYGNASSVETRTYTGIAPVTLPFSWAKGTTKSTINSTTGVSQTGLGGDYADNDYKLKFDDDNDNIIIYTDEKPVKVSIGVKMIGGESTSKFSIQESTNGAEFTEVEQLTISGSQDDVVNLETTKAFAATTRVIKLNFIKGSNVGVGPVSITANRIITLNAACNDGEKIYGTYSCNKAFTVPADLTVSALKVDGDGKLVVMDYAEGDVVKANTGVMVSAATAGDKTIALSAETGTEKDGNLLKPSGDTGIDDDAMAAAAPSCKYYRLTMHNGTQIGFWWGAENGAAFALGANKAYLAVPTGGSSAPSLLWFDNGSTGIDEVRGQTEEVRGEYYNLSGQRVANPTKGLYIVNGKKVVIK